VQAELDELRALVCQYHSAHGRLTDDMAELAERYRQVVAENYSFKAELQGLRVALQQGMAAAMVGAGAMGLGPAAACRATWCQHVVPCMQCACAQHAYMHIAQLNDLPCLQTLLRRPAKQYMLPECAHA
jgi:hypothetical protein